MSSVSKNQGTLPLTLDVVSLCNSTFCTTTSPSCSVKVVCAQRLQFSCPFLWNCSGFFLSCSVRASFMVTIDAYTSESNNQFSKPSSSHKPLLRVWQCWNLVPFLLICLRRFHIPPVINVHVSHSFAISSLVLQPPTQWKGQSLILKSNSSSYLLVATVCDLKHNVWCTQLLPRILLGATHWDTANLYFYFVVFSVSQIHCILEPRNRSSSHSLGIWAPFFLFLVPPLKEEVLCHFSFRVISYLVWAT